MIALSAVFAFSKLPLKFFAGSSYEKAEYIDYSKGYDFILNSTHYYEKIFNEGWHTSLSTGGTVLIFGEGVPFNHTAYYLSENNDERFGIKILGVLDEEIYAFPSDIPYPDFSTELPDSVKIFTSSYEEEIVTEKDIVLESDKDLNQIKKITESVYSNNLYEQLPEAVTGDEGIYRITVCLYWDNYPYYFKKELTKNTDGTFVSETTA